MAKKNKAMEPEETIIVTIKDLAEEYGVDPAKLRKFLRSQGFRAPEVPREGFGPAAKYQWEANSAELRKIRSLIEENLVVEEEE